MTVRITPFGSSSFAPPRYGSGAIMPILGGQSADRMDLAIGSENHTAAFTEDMIVGIDVTTDCYVLIAVNAVAEAGKSEPWAAGTSDYRFVRAGQRISAI